MPRILNSESNVIIEINLMDNPSLDLDKHREEFMNWIPFELKLSAGDMFLTYSEDILPSFSVKELRYLFDNLNKIIELKSNNNLIEVPFEYTSSENLFDLIIYETGEKNLVYIDFWLNMGSLTNGTIFGFSKGIRFICTLDIFRNFVNEFEEQFIYILKKNGI
jgi:hypothetical protein